MKQIKRNSVIPETRLFLVLVAALALFLAERLMLRLPASPGRPST